MSDKGAAMPIVFEKARVNLWNVAGFVLVAAGTGFGWGITYNKMDGAISSVKAEMQTVRSEQKSTKDEFNTKLFNIESKLAPMTSLQFQSARALEQVAEVKNSGEETNKRIDRVVDSFAGKLDTLVSSVNGLNTKVEVLNSTVINERQQRQRERP